MVEWLKPVLRLSIVGLAARRGSLLRLLSVCAVRALPKKPDLRGHDFGPVALSASVLGFVLAGSKPSFDYISRALSRPFAMPLP